MRQHHSWEITDEFWARAEPLIPPSETRRRTIGAGPGGGRRPVPPRTALAGIFFALRTGIPWNALPEQFGSPSPVYRCFRRWRAAGFFEELWKAGLAAYDEAAGIDWTWVSGDGCMTKAPLAVESVGRNPTDRGKKWEQRTGSSYRRLRIGIRCSTPDNRSQFLFFS
jgi:transposase